MKGIVLFLACSLATTISLFAQQAPSAYMSPAHSPVAATEETLPAGGGVTLDDGQVITGTVVGMENIFRTDASLTVNRSSGHALIDIYNSGTFGVSGGEESAVSFAANDADGTPQQLGSVSMLWANATAGAYRSQVRIHANSIATSNSDFRLTGNGGIEFFGTSDTSWPGANVVQATNGSFKVTGGGIPGPASIWNNGNRLILQGDTGGYLFQNHDSSNTILAFTDAGAATFSGAVLAEEGFTVSGIVTAGAIAAPTGQTYFVCVDDHGRLFSQAAVCQ